MGSIATVWLPAKSTLIIQEHDISDSPLAESQTAAKYFNFPLSLKARRGLKHRGPRKGN